MVHEVASLLDQAIQLGRSSTGQVATSPAQKRLRTPTSCALAKEHVDDAIRRLIDGRRLPCRAQFHEAQPRK